MTDTAAIPDSTTAACSSAVASPRHQQGRAQAFWTLHPASVVQIPTYWACSWFGLPCRRADPRMMESAVAPSPMCLPMTAPMRITLSRDRRATCDHEPSCDQFPVSTRSCTTHSAGCRHLALQGRQRPQPPSKLLKRLRKLKAGCRRESPERLLVFALATRVPVEPADGSGDLAEIRSRHPSQTRLGPKAMRTSGFCASQLPPRSEHRRHASNIHMASRSRISLVVENVIPLLFKAPRHLLHEGAMPAATCPDMLGSSPLVPQFRRKFAISVDRCVDSSEFASSPACVRMQETKKFSEDGTPAGAFAAVAACRPHASSRTS